jgi:hypothetical protein
MRHTDQKMLALTQSSRGGAGSDELATQTNVLIEHRLGCGLRISPWKRAFHHVTPGLPTNGSHRAPDWFGSRLSTLFFNARDYRKLAHPHHSAFLGASAALVVPMCLSRKVAA